MSYDWTDTRVEMAKKLFHDGLSASQIAGELGGLSRNAVIGKLTRLGLTRGGQGKGWRGRKLGDHAVTRHPPIIKRTGMNAYAPTSVLVDELLPVADVPEERPASAVTLLQLQPHHCRFPIGDPRTTDFAFCGANRVADSSYCARHHLLAYTPPPKRTTLSQEERVMAARRERISGIKRAFG